MESKPEKPARPRRRKLLVIAAAIVVVLLVGTVVGVGWYASDQAIAPKHPAGQVDVLGVRTTGLDRVVILPATNDSTSPGRYWLSWDGGSTQIGDIVSRTADRVERTVIGRSTPSTGTAARVSGSAPGDPMSGLGLEFGEITVPTELGAAPAWHLPAAGSTWVIAVHGQNGRRNAVLHIAPTMHRLGLPMLAVTYRNDAGAPPSPDGLIHLGDSEWRDLEAAVATAESLGARRVVLYGGSMGGQIVGQFLARSSRAEMVTSVVLDAPTSSMRQVGAHANSQHNLPSAMTSVTGAIIDWRTGIDVDRLDLLRYPPAVTPPTLLIQGGADDEVPARLSRDFARAAAQVGWPMEYHEFPGAGHVRAWNTDPTRYERVLADFVTRTAGPA